jgi:hypothetical protein
MAALRGAGFSACECGHLLNADCQNETSKFENNKKLHLNGQYYVDNPLGASAVNMQYIGLTTLFTAQTTISTNVVHHVKIAIEDVADDANDSAIFLKASSSCNCN